MTHEPVRLLTVYLEPERGRRLKVGRLAEAQGELLFEYDRDFIARGLEISPLRLRLRAGPIPGNPRVLDGLHGVFDDSLPDGWGRLLMDRRAAQSGLTARDLGPLDRLALVGSSAMGALVYEPDRSVAKPTVVQIPELAREVELVQRGAGKRYLDRLFALGGSPQGARPKVIVDLHPDGSLAAGSTVPAPGTTPWILKFRARTDSVSTGALEHAYLAMARAAGLQVPEARLLGAERSHPGYVAIRRFDRDGATRLHLHSFGGMLGVPRGASSLDYRDLLEVTRRVTRDEQQVREAFRRACFNVLAHNRDDHPRNVAYLMDEPGRWRLSPAFDLTFSDGPGGEHWMLVAGEGRNPSEAHLLELARVASVKRASEIVTEVRAGIAQFAKLARESGVRTAELRAVASTLGVPISVRKRPVARGRRAIPPRKKRP